MGKTLTEIAQEIKESSKKVQLIYAFNGTGKTRLSRELKQLVSPKMEDSIENESQEDTSTLTHKKILYYSSFTEDLFYWDNDLEHNSEIKIKIQDNLFTHWIFIEQGLEEEVIKNFQSYTDEKLTPAFNESFSEVTFSYASGDDSVLENIKISKGEESVFIWSIFYALLQQIIAELNIIEKEERSTDKFDNLEYIFIDDPVSSLDENYLIELAVNVAHLIKSSDSELKFVITTHNPLFYNIAYNELYKKKGFQAYQMEKIENQSYLLNKKNNDSPFTYQVYLKNKLEELFKSEINKDELKSFLIDKKSEIEYLMLRQDKMDEEKLAHILHLIKNNVDKEKIENLFIRKIISSNNNKEFTLKFFIDTPITDCRIEKYHFNLVRNIYEKISTFLGYRSLEEVLPVDQEGYSKNYLNRIVNLSSHSKHSAEEGIEVKENDKRVLKFFLEHLEKEYKFKSIFIKLPFDNKD